MKKFLGKNFLLSTKTAKKLYHSYSAKLPIIDYHCHIIPEQIANDVKFDNITQVWLYADHYKWRLMRANGVEEKYITGEASDWEKFQKWAETLPKAIGNPLYHWSHLELKNYFGYEGVLNKDSAKEVWDLTQKALSKDSMSVKNIIRKSNVEIICTTDDPIDDLKWHKKIALDKDFATKVLPAWRPDRVMQIEKTDYLQYIDKLSDVSGIKITDLDSLKSALLNRLDYFSDNGCTISDHGPEYIMYCDTTEKEASKIYAKILDGQAVTASEKRAFKVFFLLFLGREYHRRNWVMQLHYSCKRATNTRLFNTIGNDIGIDVVSNNSSSDELADFLDALDISNSLPKTIVYSLNSNDDDAINSIIGAFQGSDAIGKMQHGSAWWFNDHLEGMKKQMKSLASMGLLGNFIGMLTDSRSFLSYTRHEYFRRILCQMIGAWVENGEYPCDETALKEIIEGISYYNSKRYFNY